MNGFPFDHKNKFSFKVAALPGIKPNRILTKSIIKKGIVKLGITEMFGKLKRYNLFKLRSFSLGWSFGIRGLKPLVEKYP
jgi:hypothetical protein